MTTMLSSGGTIETKGACDKAFGALEEQTTLHAIVLAEVNGVKARIMLDTGAGSSIYQFRFSSWTKFEAATS